MSITGAIVAGVGAAGSLASSAIGANAAGNAADAQLQAANHAADLQKQESDAALGLQRDQFDQQQKNIAPWLTAGTYGVNTLMAGLQPGGQFTKTFDEQFQAPDAATEQNDPGYQFRLKQGQQALENSAAAKGTIFSGATGKAEQQYGQDYASNEYGKVYDRALGQYNLRKNNFFDNSNTQYNRYAALSGTGQVATAQSNQASQNYADQGSSIMMNTGQLQGQYALNAGDARASGYINSGNAWANGIGGSTNSILDAYLLSQMKKPGASPCWVARVVYGADNPLWLRARDAFQAKASTSKFYEVLWELYRRNGERWAEWVKTSPVLRFFAKSFFDRLIYAS